MKEGGWWTAISMQCEDTSVGIKVRKITSRDFCREHRKRAIIRRSKICVYNGIQSLYSLFCSSRQKRWASHIFASVPPWTSSKWRRFWVCANIGRSTEGSDRRDGKMIAIRNVIQAWAWEGWHVIEFGYETWAGGRLVGLPPFHSDLTSEKIEITEQGFCILWPPCP